MRIIAAPRSPGRESWAAHDSIRAKMHAFQKVKMALPLVMLIALLNHSSFKANKVLMSLFAIDLGTSPATIGVLYAMYSVFPIVLSVYAGKISDRYGFRYPVMISSCGVVGALLLPFLFPALATLFLSAALAGICNIFYVVAIQHLVGAFGEGAERTRNYGLFSITVGLSSLIGPTVAGFAIDGVGHRATFLLIAGLPAASFLILLAIPKLLPASRHQGGTRPRSRVAELLGVRPLRRVLIATAFLEAGMELYAFLMPIYGHSIGLSASQIGIVMGSFALAMMLIRMLMPALVRRSSEERVFALSMFVAAAMSLCVPFVAVFGGLLALSFVLGLGLGCGAPLSMTLSYNRSPAGRAGEAIGLRQTVNKSMEALMPAVFGFLSAAVGMVPVYALGAAALACGGWLMQRDARRKTVIR
jgi:MFS family permease